MKDKEIISIIESVINDRGQIDLKERFHSLPDKEIDRIVSVVTGDGKYMLDITPNTKAWVLRKNPAYKKESWSDRNKFLHDIIIVLITATLSLLVGILLWRLDKRSTSQEIQQLKDRLDKIENLSNSPSK